MNDFQNGQLLISLKQAPGESSGILFLPIHIRPGGPLAPEELNYIINQYNQLYMEQYLSARNASCCVFCFPVTIFGICCCAPCIFMWYLKKKGSEISLKLDQTLYQLTDQVNKSYGMRGLLFQLQKSTVGQIDTYRDGRYSKSSPINAYSLDIYWNPAFQVTQAPLAMTT
ncbi:hypothetical protein HDV04_000757 [Boothiomyces sp. JEL0838]|nr:hypothetical protein HDV04_000757 [Boothiomyces sp. JEL0838]